MHYSLCQIPGVQCWTWQLLLPFLSWLSLISSYSSTCISFPSTLFPPLGLLVSKSVLGLFTMSCLCTCWPHYVEHTTYQHHTRNFLMPFLLWNVCLSMARIFPLTCPRTLFMVLLRYISCLSFSFPFIVTSCKNFYT